MMLCYYIHITYVAVMVLNHLRMLSVISRKDYLARTRDNEAYVTSELNDLIGNDTWYVYHHVSVMYEIHRC
jgi:hypothetical protein